MGRQYWLDVFTVKTWEEFLRNGGGVSGFPEIRRNIAEKIHPGDYFICYVTVIGRFIGMLEVKSDLYFDRTTIWEDREFPVRFKVDIVLKLDPKTAVPVMNLKDKLSILKDIAPGQPWSWFFRVSPGKFNPEDAKVIIEAMEDALRNAKVYESTKAGIVTVYDRESIEPDIEPGRMTHEEMQWLLLKLGSDLGLDVWIARNDRNKVFNGILFQSMPRLRSELPRQFDEATNKTVELIDVLWLDKDAIVAAFEVEHTSAIYSGLLRMSDLIAMQPNIRINLYIVAPDNRREKVFFEINRPTFARLKPPLTEICRFISYTKLKNEIEQTGPKVRHMKHQFIDDIAEECSIP